MTEAIDRTPRDRSNWGAGPWDGEPDRIEFDHAGLPCLMRRTPRGNWCGYAAVPPGHPWHGKHYEEVDVSVHGGLTFASACSGEICHVPKPGEPDNVHWFGFDCAHSGDVMPGTAALYRRVGIQLPFCEYRDVAYVRAEVESLAEQLAAAK